MFRYTVSQKDVVLKPLIPTVLSPGGFSTVVPRSLGGTRWVRSRGT